MTMKEIYASLCTEKQRPVPREESTEETIARITPVLEETIKKIFLNLDSSKTKFLLSLQEKENSKAYPYVEIDFTHTHTWGIYVGFMFISNTDEAEKVHNLDFKTFDAFSYFYFPRTILTPTSLDGLFADEERVVNHRNSTRVGFRFIV